MDRSAAPTRLPLLAQVRGYQAAWLKADLAAGLSVAAVSLPSAIAYPAIAGLPTEVGLFATIFSMVGYALLGSSRQLMVGPDTATCLMLAGVLATLGATVEADRVNLTLSLTIAVGLLCLAAGALRLGFLANFLSRPMLVGFLAGISLSLLIGQIKRLTSVQIETSGLFRPILEFIARVDETHVPTLIVGLGTLIFLRLLRHLAPSVPAPLLAVILGIALSMAVDLQSHGVAVVGALPQIAFSASLPSLGAAANLDFLGGAFAIMLVSFGSGIVTARSFGMKARSEVDANKELFGFGAANIASGLFGGFPISASDSRTAVNFAIGGKTQLTSLIAAATVAGTVLFIADVLSYLPAATLGAILVSAAIDLIDLKELRTLRRMTPSEFWFAIITMLGVVMVGVLQGVFIAIAATLAHLIWTTAHPRLALLGRIPGSAGLYKLHRYPEAHPIPGLTIVVLQSALVFFNAEFVKRRLLKIANATRAADKWFILDATAINVLDSTGLRILEEVQRHLAERGVAFGLADLNSGSRQVVDRAGLRDRMGKDMIFPSAEAALTAFEALADHK
ncbi:MAG TPA: SulP family inorganic anion transporter [Hyphomonadaceae bacterium]|nr:SulP family inorganic anion transporter [Hyphomonadaceae bacterium]